MTFCNSLLLPDPTLTLLNVSAALDTLRDWDYLSILLEISDKRCSLIESKHSTPDEHREAGLGLWLSISPHVSWQWLAGRLYYKEEKNALEAVMKYVCVPAGLSVCV